MDDEKNVNPNDVSKEEKSKTQETVKTGFLKRKFGEFKGEFTKIIWPSRKDLVKQSLTVIVTSLIFGVIICGMDMIFSYAYQALVFLVG